MDEYAFLHVITFLLDYNVFFSFNRLGDQSSHGVVISEVSVTENRKLENEYNLLESDDDIQNSATVGRENLLQRKKCIRQCLLNMPK